MSLIKGKVSQIGLPMIKIGDFASVLDGIVGAKMILVFTMPSSFSGFVVAYKLFHCEEFYHGSEFNAI